MADVCANTQRARRIRPEELAGSVSQGRANKVTEGNIQPLHKIIPFDSYRRYCNKERWAFIELDKDKLQSDIYIWSVRHKRPTIEAKKFRSKNRVKISE